MMDGPGERCWYSNLLRAGRSGDRTPVGGETFCTSPDRLWAQSASYTVGTGSFEGAERQRSGVDHTPL
jgi:hypothetical protein